jgi:hypothetical protein
VHIQFHSRNQAIDEPHLTNDFGYCEIVHARDLDNFCEVGYKPCAYTPRKHCVCGIYIYIYMWGVASHVIL